MAEYEPINPQSSFDREEFVESYKNFSKLRGYLKTLVKDSEEPTAIYKTAKLLHGDPQYYEKEKIQIRPNLEEAVLVSNENMARYVRENLSSFLDILEDEDLMSLILSLPLYRTEMDYCNEVIDAVNNFRCLQTIAKEPEKIAQYVAQELERKPELKEEFAKAENKQEYISKVFNSCLSEVGENLNKKLMVKTGETKRTNRSLLEEVFRESLNIAEEKYEEEENSGDKNDVWEDVVRPYYEAVASLA